MTDWQNKVNVDNNDNSYYMVENPYNKYQAKYLPEINKDILKL